MSATPSPAQRIAAFTTIYLVWGSTYLGIRMAVQTLPPLVMASLRFICAGLILLGLLRLRGPLQVTVRQLRDNAVVGVLLLLGGNGLVAWAEQYVPSGITALIIGVQPMVMVLTEWAWPGGKRPPALVFIGLALGFGGVALLVAPSTASSEVLNVGGVAAILFACVFWAFGSIYGRNARTPAQPFVASGLQMVSGSLALAAAAGFRGEWSSWSPAATSATSWWATAYLTLVGSLVGFTTFAWLMKHSTPARVATYAYVNPIVAVFLGWLVLSEPLGWRIAAAGIVIVLSVVIITVARQQVAKSSST
jgi:drug/metabolite transporter (DMT)-like permease